MMVGGSCVVDCGVLAKVSSSPCPVEGPVRSRGLSLAGIAAQEFGCQLFDISPNFFGWIGLAPTMDSYSRFTSISASAATI